MKSSFLIGLFLLLNMAIRAGEIVLTGNFFGNNLVVINPNSGDGYCVTEVLVNGKTTKDEIRSNSFEIDFGLIGLKIGDPVKVVIRYHEGCVPKVINPSALLADQNFAYTAIKFDRSTKLTWSVKGDIGDDPFFVEQFRWNKWMQVGEVSSSDTVRRGQFTFDAIFHSGFNQFRVFRIDAFGNPAYSKIVKYNNIRMIPVELSSTKITDKLIFSAETLYELFDLKGNYMSGGYAKEVDVTDYEKGKYFLNYDVKSVTITKK